MKELIDELMVYPERSKVLVRVSVNGDVYFEELDEIIVEADGEVILTSL